MINKMCCLQLYQVVGEAKTGDVVGEIGVLCYRRQHFTIRTKRLSQLLHLNRTTILNLAQSHVEDGTIIMNNFLHVYKILELLQILFSSRNGSRR